MPGIEIPTMTSDTAQALLWVSRLESELLADAGRVQRMNAYYAGDHRLAFASERFRNAFGGLFSAIADNWCPLVVDAVAERTDVEGFRVGDDTEADGMVWELWQQQQLDAESEIAHTESLIAGRSYALVWPDRNGRPVTTIEHASQVIVRHEPGHRSHRRAALKRWWDPDTEMAYATLYTPDAIWKWQAPAPSSAQHLIDSRNQRLDQRTIAIDFFEDPRANRLVQAAALQWVPREVPGEAWPLRNPLKRVPVVPLYNSPRLMSLGDSEIRPVIPMQDAANKLVADMMVAAEFAAYPQRYVTGMEIPEPDENGVTRPPFDVGIDALLALEDPAAAFGQFTAADLNNYVSAINMLVEHMAAQTRTPSHYFYLGSQPPNGESARAYESGLVRKAHRKARHWGEAWEDVVRLMLDVVGDPRASEAKIETVWGLMETQTAGMAADAAIKRREIGVPWQQLMEDLGYSQTQIDRMRVMNQQDALEQAMAAEQLLTILDRDEDPATAEEV